MNLQNNIPNKPYFKALLAKIGFLALVVFFFAYQVTPASASFLSFVGNLFSSNQANAEDQSTSTSDKNSQTIPLLQAVSTPTMGNKNQDDTNISISQNSLVSEVGPLGTSADVALMPTPSDQITVYRVRQGDTIASVAKMFDVTTSTIVSINNLSRGQSLKLDQMLTILPESGTQYTVKKGDTLASIAKKYKIDAKDISLYNDIGAGDALALGDEILIPSNADLVEGDTPPIKNINTKKPKVSSGSYGMPALSAQYSGPDLGNYFLRPVSISSSVVSQDLHFKDGVDLASSIGTPIMAAADGIVIIAKPSGYNQGYGEFVAIEHPNGTETLYGHMSRVDVVQGQSVSRGEIIGAVGNTGHSTGPHLHFEVRHAKNPLGQGHHSYTGN